MSKGFKFGIVVDVVPFSALSKSWEYFEVPASIHGSPTLSDVEWEENKAMYKADGRPTPVTAFLLGLVLDMANNTVGIHIAAATFVAYIRPKMLQLTSNREQVDDIPGAGLNKSFGWFLKYLFLSMLAFHTVLILAEAFSFANFSITLLRIVCSTVVSCFFILLYYFIALKKKQE